ncbi:hypothetical protein KAW80_00015 [Candidatus Babeliales bacterium]|nr:hypothetical protein [Candidatus Babeliales bacterium]
MRKSTFYLIIFISSLSFIFLKIYQHNVFVNAVFSKQKLISQKNILKLEINALEQELAFLKNKHSLLAEAEQQLGMAPIKISQINFIPKEA